MNRTHSDEQLMYLLAAYVYHRFLTTTPCQSAGVFHGNLVVTMRPFLPGEFRRRVI